MPGKDADYEEILDGNVDDVRQAIRNLENPDYTKLLELEKEGKDRKTIKEFLDSRTEEAEEASEEEAEDVAPYTVEEIEEETSGGILGNQPREALVLGGVVLGLFVGLLVGSMVFGGSAVQKEDPAVVKESLQTYVNQLGFNVSSIEGPEVRSGMYYYNVSIEQTVRNQTQTVTQSVYVTLDGKYLFPERKVMGRTVVPVNLENSLQAPRAPAGPNATAN